MCCFRIVNAYTQSGRIANPTERRILMCCFRIENAYTQGGRIANPTERKSAQIRSIRFIRVPNPNCFKLTSIRVITKRNAN